MDTPQDDLEIDEMDSERHNPRWISIRRQKPREEDSCGGWVIYMTSKGVIYFNFWDYDWSTSPHSKIVAWAPIPFWSGQGLKKSLKNRDKHEIMDQNRIKLTEHTIAICDAVHARSVKHAFSVAMEHLANGGYPRQNWEQFVALVESLKLFGDSEMLRWNRIYHQNHQNHQKI